MSELKFGYKPNIGNLDNILDDVQVQINEKAAQSSLDAEASTRATADTALDDRVTSLESGMTGIVGGLVIKGLFDASAGNFDAIVDPKRGYFYKVSVAGTIDSVDYEIGDMIIINKDITGSPTTADIYKIDNTEAADILRIGNIDDITLELVSDKLQVKDGSITNAKLASGIDAAKIADGSVSNAEFETLDGNTVNIKSKFDAVDVSLNTLSSTIATLETNVGNLPTYTAGSGLNLVNNEFSLAADDITIEVSEGQNGTSSDASILHLDGTLNDTLGHSWSLLGSAALATSDVAKFGTGCVYIPASSSNACGIQSPIDLSLHEEFTIKMFINPNTYTGWRTILGSDNDHEFGLAIVDNTIQLYCGDGSSWIVNGETIMNLSGHNASGYHYVSLTKYNRIGDGYPVLVFQWDDIAVEYPVNRSYNFPSGTMLRIGSWGGYYAGSPSLAGYVDEIMFDTTTLKDATPIGSGLAIPSEPFTVTTNTASVVQVKDGSITNAKLASGIDATKIADGSVSNAEFETLDGNTVNIKSKFDAVDASLNTLSSTIATLETSSGSNDSAIQTEASTRATADTALDNRITDIEANYLHKDGSVAMTGALNAGNYKITNVANPTNANDAVNLAYLDAHAQGYKVKEAVKLATNHVALPDCTASGNGVGKTLTGNSNGLLTIDGVNVEIGDRILVKDQANAVDNGIYTVTQAGDAGNVFILTRATDFDGSPDGEVQESSFFFIMSGEDEAGEGYVLATINPAIDTSELTFRLTSTARIYNAGTNIEISGSTINLASGIDAAKIADGSVSNAEFETLDGNTVNIKSKFDAVDASLNTLSSNIATLALKPSSSSVSLGFEAEVEITCGVNDVLDYYLEDLSTGIIHKAMAGSYFNTWADLSVKRSTNGVTIRRNVGSSGDSMNLIVKKIA